MVPLGNILTGVGCLGAIVMLPHMIKPATMCKLFLEEKWTDDKSVQDQLIFFHFGLFSGLWFLAVLVAIAGQTCPCLPVAFGFIFIITTRLIQVGLGGYGPDKDLIGLSKKPVMLQAIVGTILILVVLVATIMAMGDAEYLAATAEMEAIAFDKMETAAPLVYFLISVFSFFALMQAPGICMADKMIDGYMPSALAIADKYAGAQMKFYMSFQSRENSLVFLLLAAVILMSPDITYVCIYVCCMAVFFCGFCIHAIVYQREYGFALPGMMVWMIFMCIIFGATFMGLLLM